MLLDVNVVIDLLLEREPWVAHARTLAVAALDGRIEGLVAASSFATIHYLIRRQAGDAVARACLSRCMATFKIATVDDGVVRKSLTIGGPDYEDDVQIATAMAAGANVIVTRDPRGFAHSPVRAASPAEAVALIVSIAS